MSRVTIRLLTVECDSADESMIRALLGDLGPSGPGPGLVLMPQASETKAPRAETKPAKRETLAPVAEPEPVVVEAPPAPPLRVAVPLGEKPPTAHPTGLVQGFVAPAADRGAELDRLIALVYERPGISVQQLAQLTLGSASQHNTRRIDMLIGPIVMAGKLARTNGHLYANAALATANPPPMLRHGRPGQSAPLSDVQRKKEVYNRLVAAFTEDNEYPIDKLAKEVFGDAEGKSTRKIRLMLIALCSTERLMKLGADRFRPVGEKEELGRGADEAEESEAGEADLESNGAPEEDDEQELDLS